MSRPVRSLTFTIVRTVIGVGIAVFLVSKTMDKANMSPADLWRHIRQAEIGLLILAVLLHGVVLCLTASRWRLLLHAQKIPIRWHNALRLTLIGFFFNLAIPGSVGGDISKVGYLAKARSGRATEGIFSIVIDRLIGVFGLFLIASLCVLLSLSVLTALPPESAFVRNAAFLIGLGSVAGIGGFLCLEFHDKLLRLPGLRSLWPLLNRITPHKIVSTVQRLVAAVDTYRRNKGTLAVAVALSLCVHSCLALDLYLIGKSLGESTLPVREYFLTTQASNAIAAIPVTPGGVGLRDRSNQEFLAAFGMSADMAALVPITMTLIILAWAMVGLIVFITSPAAKAIVIPPEKMPPQLPLEPCE